MADIPVVSVCVITRNQEHYIRQCLESILSQQGDWKLEVLVGDDCSDDSTANIIEELAVENPETLRCIRHCPNVGPAANTQSLIAQASGQYIARVDADDYWLPGKLEAQVKYLQANPDCSAVYTNAVTRGASGSPVGVFNNAGDARFTLADLMRMGNFLNNSSVLFRQQSIRPWLEIKEPLIDYRIHLLHARFGFLGHIGKPMTVYRMNAPGSMVAERNNYVRKLYWKALGSVPQELVPRRDRALAVANFARRVFFHSLSTGNGRLLKEWIPRVYRESPLGMARTSGYIFASIIKAGMSELWDRAARLTRPRRVKILYKI